MLNLDNILIDENPSGNILVYNISYKTLIAAKSLRIKFDEIVGFIRNYDRTRYLVSSLVFSLVWGWDLFTTGLDTLYE